MIFLTENAGISSASLVFDGCCYIEFYFELSPEVSEYSLYFWLLYLYW